MFWNFSTFHSPREICIFLEIILRSINLTRYWLFHACQLEDAESTYKLVACSFSSLHKLFRRNIFSVERNYVRKRLSTRKGKDAWILTLDFAFFRRLNIVTSTWNVLLKFIWRKNCLSTNISSGTNWTQVYVMTEKKAL